MPKVKLKNSLFLELDQDMKVDVDFDLLQSMFFRKEADIKAEEEMKQQAKKKQESKTKLTFSVLDAKRLSDVAIAKASLGMNSEDLIEAINSLDSVALEQEHIEKLIAMAPTPEECTLLAAAKEKYDLMEKQE